MAVTLNPDKEVVRAVKEGLKRTGGYCPCRLERTEDNKCMSCTAPCHASFAISVMRVFMRCSES